MRRKKVKKAFRGAQLVEFWLKTVGKALAHRLVESVRRLTGEKGMGGRPVIRRCRRHHR